MPLASSNQKTKKREKKQCETNSIKRNPCLGIYLGRRLSRRLAFDKNKKLFWALSDVFRQCLINWFHRKFDDKLESREVKVFLRLSWLKQIVSGLLTWAFILPEIIRREETNESNLNKGFFQEIFLMLMKTGGRQARFLERLKVLLLFIKFLGKIEFAKISVSFFHWRASNLSAFWAKWTSKFKQKSFEARGKKLLLFPPKKF